MNCLKLETLSTLLTTTVATTALALTLGTAASSVAAGQDLEWAHGLAFNDPHVVATVPGDTDVVMAGRFSGVVDFDFGAGVTELTSLSGQDVFVARYDSTGGLLWVQQLSGPELGSMTVGSNGNVYVTGSFSGTQDFDPGTADALFTSAGGRDGYVLRLDGSGQYIGAVTFESPGEVRTRQVKLDAAGNVLVLGTFRDMTDFDPSSGVRYKTPTSTEDGFVAKLSFNGSLWWVKTFGSVVGFSQNLSLAVDGNKNILVAGRFRDSIEAAGQTFSGPADRNTFLLKYLPGGSLDWGKVIVGGGQPWTEFGGSVATDADDNIFVTGDFDGLLQVDGQTMTSTDGDLFLVKLTPAGTALWLRSILSAVNESGSVLAVSSTGAAVVSGRRGMFPQLSSPDPDLTKSTEAASFNASLSKFSGDGTLLWSHVYSNFRNQIYSLALDADDDIYVAGGDPLGSTLDVDFSAAEFLVTERHFVAKYSESSVLPLNVNLVCFESPGGFEGEVSLVCTAATSGGTSPYTYAWTQDGFTLPDTGSQVTVETPSCGFSPVLLSVTVTDSFGATGQGTLDLCTL